MKRLLFVAAAVMVCLPLAAQSQAGSVYVSDLFNTGVDASGNPLGNDTIGDSHYQLVSVPGGTSQILVRSGGGFPFPYWLAPDLLSAWIGPNDLGTPPNTDDLNGPVGLYDYRTTFSIGPILNPNMVRISGGVVTAGGVSADNQIVGIKLNGRLVVPANTSNNSSTGHTQFTQFYPFDITNGYLTGTNTLDFLVHNDRYPLPGDNPTGLRVEMSSTDVTSGTIPTLFNTGVNQFGQPLANDHLGDPHYTLVSVPGGTSQVMVRSAGGFPFPYWLGPDSASAWIGPNDPGTTPNVDDLNGPVGPYDYQTTFNLTGFDPTSVVISGGISGPGGWSTDNQGIAILLNGHQVWGPNNYDNGDPAGHAQYAQFFPFSIDAYSDPYFSTGINTLDFIVNNDYNPAGGDNPTGLRVEMTGTANYAALANSQIIPEPLSVIFFGTGLVAVGGFVARRRMLRKV